MVGRTIQENWGRYMKIIIFVKKGVLGFGLISNKKKTMFQALIKYDIYFWCANMELTAPGADKLSLSHKTLVNV